MEFTMETAAAGAEDGAALSVDDEAREAEVEQLLEQPLFTPLLPAMIITIDSVVVMAYSVVADRPFDAVDAPLAEEDEETTGAADDDRRKTRRAHSTLIILAWCRRMDCGEAILSCDCRVEGLLLLRVRSAELSCGVRGGAAA
jgi:hypothetical protein